MPDSATPRIKPPALRLGDTVGVVAPASNIKRRDLDAGCDSLRRAGYQPFYFDSILEQDLYFAGSVERRARELEEMFAREEVRAILCARGGYGANYLLDEIALDKIKAHPKIFVGYSDITTLLTHFIDAAGFVTFHGPMVAKDWAHEDGVDIASWQAAVAGQGPWKLALGPNSGVSGIVEGSAEGILYGGCLSLLAASLGTNYEFQAKGTILFLEDVAAKPFQDETDRVGMRWLRRVAAFGVAALGERGLGRRGRTGGHGYLGVADFGEEAVQELGTGFGVTEGGSDAEDLEFGAAEGECDGEGIVDVVANVGVDEYFFGEGGSGGGLG